MGMTGECSPGECGFAAWSVVDDMVEVRLHHNLDGDGWVGVGFSRDRQMGQDDIYYCQKRGDQVGVVSAYSVGMSRPIELQPRARQKSNQNLTECCFYRALLKVTRILV